MMDIKNVIISIIIMSLITFFTRVFPFIFFRKKEPPKIILFAEKYIPPMIMVILVVYCLKDVKWPYLPYGIPEILALVLVVVFHLKLKNPLISIFGGTIFYMIITQNELIQKMFFLF